MLTNRDVYHLRVCSYLLDRLENHGSKEPTNTSGYTIEHIMPQNENLSEAWRKMLGTHWKEIQVNWLHRLGNLTLTGYNSTYSDRSFEEKKNIPGGFAESSVRLNKFVREQPTWTPKEMEKRTSDLVTQALTVWPPLQIDDALLEAAKHAELREMAQRREIASVPMTAAARDLLEKLRPILRGIDPAVVEIAENKSVSYHCPGFFLEILPRKHHLTLLAPLEHGEVDDPHGLASDATAWKFLINAKYSGGTFLTIRSEEDIPHAMPIIQKSFQMAIAMPRELR